MSPTPRWLVTFPLLCALLPFAASAATDPSTPPLVRQMLLPGEVEDGMPRPGAAPLSGARMDTLWFGGDDGTGTALFSPDLANPDYATWTWDAGGPDPAEGWSTRDLTCDEGVFFYRVTADSFAGDPCVPMFPGEAGGIWCGVHEDDADLMGWVGGMGYGNAFCQRALSPFMTCVGQRNIVLSWKMFQDSEDGYDFTNLHILAYDGATPPNLLDDIEVAQYDGIIGSYTSPAVQNKTIPAAQLPVATATVRVEFRFTSDGGWSDEDGFYDTPCGPFGADDIAVTIAGAPVVPFDFEAGPEGWTFEKCGGIGAFMAVWPEEVWAGWLEAAGIVCPCALSGNALGCVDPSTPFPIPGHPSGHHEEMQSGICVVDRDLYPANDYNDTFAELDAYFYLRPMAGTFYRPGFKYYPYTTPDNPTPRWSQRLGPGAWYLSGSVPMCLSEQRTNLSEHGLPRTWEQMRYVFEVACDCSDCTDEGNTWGSPLIDNVRIGLSGRPDVPAIALDDGHLFHDGFGQNFPTYLEPGDPGNANVSFDNSRDDPDMNDCHADSAVIEGPLPTDRHWLCGMAIRVERKGPRQDLVPGYVYWKSRLQGDPESQWVSVLMDSAQAANGLVSSQAFATYFHEQDPGFRGPHAQDYNERNEILPDLVFTPGTTIRYYYAPYWSDTPDVKGHYGPAEGWDLEILPGMQLVEGSDWDVEWPSVLYIDAYNRGSEIYFTPLLDQLGLEHDRFDALDQSCCAHTRIRRTFINGTWGNNGMTVEQLLGYRLVILDTGRLQPGALDPEDFTLLQGWLTASDCPEAGAVRRGLILNGDEIAGIMDHPDYGIASAFMHGTLRAHYEGIYRVINNDDWPCVGLEGSGGGVFSPAEPGVMLYGNGCPTFFNFSVIGTDPGGGIPSVGNLLFHSYDPDAYEVEVPYAQVVVDMSNQPTSNWKAGVDGFSLAHVIEAIDPDECDADSALIVSGAADILGPELIWITDVNDPFVPWRYPCEDASVDEDNDGHLAGAVDYLYACRPNPFRSTATIRFHLAGEDHVTLTVYDVTGRLVKTLADGKLGAGETVLVWDGTNDAGTRVGSGVYWVQMHTAGFVSAKRMISLN